MNLTDIHCHIIPGVDDGAKDFKTSCSMLKLASKDGISRIILTPHNKPGHHNCSQTTIVRLRDELQSYCDTNCLGITLFCGNEILYRHDFLDVIENQKALGLCESKYYLIEFNPRDDFRYIRDGLYEVLSNGYVPIIAHAERYDCLLEDSSYIEELKALGVLIQLNADSIMGKLGSKTKKFCKYLLREDMVSFVASDAHDSLKRVPKLGDCAKYIARKYGDSMMYEIFEHNPDCVIYNRVI